MKTLKQEDPVMTLSYRSTPCSTTGFSPAKLLMGRKIRTTLPTLEKNLLPKRPSRTASKRLNSLTTSTAVMEPGPYLPCDQEMLYSPSLTMKSHGVCQR
ncbi:hypothetical protein VZT92_012529 [Zoarces viviparus]|uniref:Uncharacterized protein n=1 Tax=Zoarces viviparus TaxID=48416 RepID=A0AAW1F162_ZOAVI